MLATSQLFLMLNQQSPTDKCSVKKKQLCGCAKPLSIDTHTSSQLYNNDMAKIIESDTGLNSGQYVDGCKTI